MVTSTINLENHNIILQTNKPNFTDVHFDLLIKGNNNSVVLDKKDVAFRNSKIKDIYDVYSRNKDEKE